LRAFARHLAINPSALSEIMAGKRRASAELSGRLAARLGLSPDEAAELTKTQSNAIAYTTLDADKYRVVAEWHYFAILSLAETSTFRADASWIAKRLGIGSPEASEALARLERLGLLMRTEAGELKPTGASFSTTDGVRDASVRYGHFQNLQLAERSLDRDDLERRDFSAITMAIDVAKVPEARRLIRDFRDRLCVLLESGDKTEVYKLCVQLFPLTHDGVTHAS
jgi:uncharacterized protein (TIGR02147 family)